MAGRPALVSERVTGDDLFNRLTRKPWLVLRVGGTLGRAHAAMHEHPVPDSLPELTARSPFASSQPRPCPPAWPNERSTGSAPSPTATASATGTATPQTWSAPSTLR